MVIFSNAFIILRQRAKRVEHECYVNYITTVENSMRDNLKAFWSYDQANKRTSHYNDYGFVSPKNMACNSSEPSSTWGNLLQ